jgi:hypothetical protein
MSRRKLRQNFMDDFAEYDKLVKSVTYFDGSRADIAVHEARQKFFCSATEYAEALQVLNKKFDSAEE